MEATLPPIILVPRRNGIPESEGPFAADEEREPPPRPLQSLILGTKAGHRELASLLERRRDLSRGKEGGFPVQGGEVFTGPHFQFAAAENGSIAIIYRPGFRAAGSRRGA